MGNHALVHARFRGYVLDRRQFHCQLNLFYAIVRIMIIIIVKLKMSRVKTEKKEKIFDYTYRDSEVRYVKISLRELKRRIQRKRRIRRTRKTGAHLNRKAEWKSWFFGVRHGRPRNSVFSVFSVKKVRGFRTDHLPNSTDVIPVRGKNLYFFFSPAWQSRFACYICL